MIRVRNVVLYGSTSSCTLVTVPLSVNFTCLELAARRITTGQETTFTCTCVVVRPCVLSLLKWAQPPNGIRTMSRGKLSEWL